MEPASVWFGTKHRLGPDLCSHTNDKILLRWRHNGRDSVSNQQPHECLLNRLFSRRSKKTSKLRVTGLCAGKSSGTGGFPAQRASNAENVSIWWRHLVTQSLICINLLFLSTPPKPGNCPQNPGVLPKYFATESRLRLISLQFLYRFFPSRVYMKCNYTVAVHKTTATNRITAFSQYHPW